MKQKVTTDGPNAACKTRHLNYVPFSASLMVAAAQLSFLDLASGSPPDRPATTTYVGPARREGRASSTTRPANELAPGMVLQEGRSFASACVYTTRPLSRTEAEPLHIARLPREASDVQVACSREWLTQEVWVSFTAPAELCKSTAVALLRDWNQANPGNTVSTELRPISNAAQKPNSDRQHESRSGASGSAPVQATSEAEDAHEDPSTMSHSWFAPEKIVNGVEGGEREKSVQVWVDLDLGRLFYHDRSGGTEKPKTGKDSISTKP